MSENELTERDRLGARQFGEEIIEPGEPFNGDTLSTIRALVAEHGTSACAAAPASPDSRDQDPACAPDETRPVAAQDAPVASDADRAAPPERETVSEAVGQSGWRRLTITERAPVRWVRRRLATPRGIAVMLLLAVTLWEPWFIPVLFAALVFAVLIVGALIGQDRLGRIALYLLRRHIWADPARGAALQKVLPARWHPFLYKPLGEDDAWEGPVDPRFAERLARLR